MGVVVLLGVKLHPTSAAAQGAEHEFREAYLGMEVRIVVAHGSADSAAMSARRAFDGVAAHEALLSDWRARSEVRELATVPQGEWRSISSPLRDVLALALRVARASDGAFDPTIGPLSALWREARRTGTPIDEQARKAALARVGYWLVELDSAGSRVRFAVPGVQLDLGAVAKGWILDRALDSLRANGVQAALVEAGGDVVVHGAPPGREGWQVLVPRARGDTLLVLSSGAVSSSGARAQRAPTADGEEGHLIDPRAGLGAVIDEVLSVVGPAGAVTDALATALALTPGAQRAALAARFGVAIVAAGASPRTDPTTTAGRVPPVP